MEDNNSIDSSKTEKKYSVFKATIWYTICNILTKGVTFFVLPIFTNLMSTEEYGIYSIFVSYMTIVEVIVLFGLSSTVRIAKYDHNIDFDRYVSTIVLIPPFFTAIFAIVLNVFVTFTGDFLSMSRELWNYLLLTVAFNSIASIILGKLIINGKYKLYALYSLIFAVLNVGLSLLLCFTAYREQYVYMARVIGGTIAQVVACVLLVVFSKSIRKIDLKYVKRAIVWGIPLLLHTLATVVLTQSDKIIVQNMDSYSAAGIYSIAVTFITIPLTIYTSLESAWCPWFYKKLDEKKYVDIKQFNNIYILLICLMIAMFMLASPTLIKLFTNENYWDSYWSLVPLSLSVFFELLYGISVSVEYFYKKTWYITLGTVVTVVFNIGLDILFVWLWGYIAAAYATVISKFLLFVFHFVISKTVDKNKMFNEYFVLVMVVFLVGVASLSLFFCNLFWVRLLIACIICIVFVFLLIKKKNVFINVFKNKE